MKILSIKVDELPTNCSYSKECGDGCVFNQNKYCVLKMACNQSNAFVQNNRDNIPSDCPLILYN